MAASKLAGGGPQAHALPELTSSRSVQTKLWFESQFFISCLDRGGIRW